MTLVAHSEIHITMKKINIIFIFLFIVSSSFAQDAKREIFINKKYLNLPVESSQERQKMILSPKGSDTREFIIRLSKGVPDYWVFTDVSSFIGKNLLITFPEYVKGLDDIYQSDEIAGADSLYKELNRPQFHFTTRCGWINDPNGLVYYDGEYHLFYQLNPYEINWENMHWGHAVSKDLVHWEELPVALYPDDLGTMFSGSAVLDVNNTSGFKTGEETTIVAAYTAMVPEKQVQCIAYSNDKGKTFTKFDGNPVIDSKEKWNSVNTRDPKVFWHEKSGKWVMVLFEKVGISIYNSDDLKKWDYQSHINGFWECPELFELPVDKNESVKKWVLYSASGTYMIGNFDGKKFTTETDKLCYFRGKMFAAQTYNKIPESDGRRIQIGWGRINHPGMSFNQMMTFPTELSLRSTREGIRLFSEPVREIEKLYKASYQWNNLSPAEANENLKNIKGKLFHIKMTFEHLEGDKIKFIYNGNEIFNYNISQNTLNGEFYGGMNIEKLTFDFELLIDKTSVEIFVDNGRFTIIDELPASKDNSGFTFDSGKSQIHISKLEINELQSIW